MSPSFGNIPPVKSKKSSTMSSSAKRLAARARKASSKGDDDSRRDNKRHRGEPSASKAEEPRTTAEKILAAERQMSLRLKDDLWYDDPIVMTYNPLVYASEAHEWYTKQFGNSRKEILLVGMNPGPWGMGQTGIPFGEVSAVRDWLKMPQSINIGKPEKEHPRRPVTGMECTRSDVCGHRLWNEWAKSMHGDNSQAFFDRFFVYTYCPVLFLEKSGNNRSPNIIHPYERQKVTEICDEALLEVVKAIRPRMVVGIGGWAMERSRFALRDLVKKGLLVGSLMHPSPSSQLANQGWAKKSKKKMQELIAEMSAAEDVWVPKG